jgi:ABC-type lipoprotein release transport system permease subunit
MFSFAGARRTQSSYPRFLRSANGSDMSVSSSGGYSPKNDRAIASFPEVVSSRTYVSFQTYALEGGHPDFAQDFEAIGTFDGRYFDQDRFTPTSGRLPDPSKPDEVAVNQLLADDLGYHLGQRLVLGVYGFERTGQGFPEHPGPPSLRRTVTVVGIGRFPDEVLQDEADRTNRMLLTPAFTRAARRYVTYGLQGLVLRHGDADVEALEHRVLRRFAAVNIRETRIDRFHAIGATHPVSVALAIFGAISAVAAILLTSQALLASARAARSDQDVLRAVGASPRMILRRALVGPGVVVVAGVGLGIALAIAASPLMPAGPIRTVTGAEVDIDVAVLGLGGAAFIAVIFGIAAVGAIRSLPHRRVARGTGAAPASRVVERLGNALSPSPAAGLRMALGRGGSSASVPALVVVAGAMIAAAALTTAVTFGGSLSHLVDTPHLYGWNWDAAVLPGNGYGNLPLGKTGAALRADPDVESSSGAYFGLDGLDGLSTPVLGLAVGARVQPPIIRGRHLEQPAEIVLGAATAARLGKDIGDTVVVTTEKRRRVETVVGIATLPTIGQLHVVHTSLGVGAIVAPELTQGHDRDILGVERKGLGPNVLFVRYRPGVDPEAALRRLDRTVQPLAGFAGVVTLPVQRPAEIASSDAPTALPVILAGSLCLAALVSLLLAVVSSSRRYHWELAMCRTLGFTARQVTGALAWQATIIVLIALAVGVPAGVALGAGLWRLFADQLDVVASVVLPITTIAVTTAIALIVANVVAAVPGRAAARTSPAAALRQG